ncbi:hypothetical protein T07_8661 [Trichinella nelsoni]|uniref:Uncharacterized protein n=1 Tax=Trichinella nelsoni TaxID=6336 RepID=A0A0V0SC33_9BILA|nr:hypothetical protein T07_8661 [Trichinella nelsoni]
MEYSRFYRYLHWNEFVLQSFFKLAADRVQWSIRILLAVVEMQLCQQSRPGISSAALMRRSAIINLFSIAILQIPCGMSIMKEVGVPKASTNGSVTVQNLDNNCFVNFNLNTVKR